MSPEESFIIATNLKATGRWRAYLSEEEAEIFLIVSKSDSSWKEFINNPASVLQIDSPKARVNVQAEGIGDNRTRPFAVVAAFRIRSMIYSQIIPKVVLQHPEISAVVDCNELESVVLDTHMDDVEDRNDKPEEPDPEIIPIDDMFYSLEYDVEALERHKKIQERIKREESETLKTTEKVEEPTQTLPVHSNLKYLFELIGKDAEPTEQAQLKQILTETRQSRSKWASNTRIGQEVLYESLERVLCELKDFTEYSTPFLQKVSKKEVPNYYDVIKRPMDLGTMTKKLKELQYMSKKEFADDLYLIWSNCMTFNVSPPDNIYRKKASAMKRKTTELLKKVPDIVIQIRELDSDDEKESGDNESNNGTKVMLPQMNQNSLMDEANIKAEHTDLQASLSNVQEVNGAHIKPEGIKGLNSSTTLPSDTIHPTLAAESALSEDISMEHNQEDMVDQGGIQVIHWKDVTAEQRVKLSLERQHQLSLKFADRTPIRWKVADITEYLNDMKAARIRNEKRRKSIFSSNPQKVSTPSFAKEQSNRNAVKWFFPEFNYNGACLPELKGAGLVKVGYNEIEGAELFLESENAEVVRMTPTLSDYEESQPPSESKLEVAIRKNMQELKTIKDIRTKIFAREIGVDDYPLPAPPPKYIPDPENQRYAPFLLNKPCSEAIFKQATCKLLGNAGFDTADSSALNTLMDVGMQYLQNLGKTLRMYLDRFGKRMSYEEIVMHTFKENGVSTIKSLESYVKNDVQRYGTKLVDLRKKMAYAYQDMIGQSGEQEVIDGDFHMDEYEDRIASGNFMGQLGLDFLNLQEFDVEATSVPPELWRRLTNKTKKARVSRKLLEKEDAIVPIISTSGATGGGKVSPPSPWPPIDPENQIGLLKEFYLQKAQSEDLMEDDAKPKQTRPSKSKHNLKLAITRKRQVTGDLDVVSSRKRKKVGATAVSQSSGIVAPVQTIVGVDGIDLRKKR